MPASATPRRRTARRLSQLATVLAVVAVCAAGSDTYAQSTWLLPRNVNAVTLEILKPSFDLPGVRFVSSAWVLEGRYAFDSGQRTYLTIDLPVAHLGVDGGESETAVGNPYVGVTNFAREAPIVYELGLRIPVASESGGGLTGLLADFDRFEAYATDTFSLRGTMSYFPSRSGDWVLLTRLGSSLLFNTGSVPEGAAKADLYANYAFFTWYLTSRFQAGLGFAGRFLITDPGSIAERTAHQLGASFQADLSAVIPGVHVRLPLDDNLTEFVDVVVGLSVVVPLTRASTEQ